MSKDGLTVLSLFDGMSCGAIALHEAGIPVKQYFASEIDRQAIRQTQHNFPDTIQLGSVTDVKVSDLPPIDLLIGGSPCQGFSFAGKQLNFSDPRSKLFFEYVRILREIQAYNPDVKFLLENVRMRTEYENVISKELGLFPVMINSSLVSAQNRVRLYWTNIAVRRIDNLFGHTIHTNIPPPSDRRIYLRDILDSNAESRYFLSRKEIDRLVKVREYDYKEIPVFHESGLFDLDCEYCGGNYYDFQHPIIREYVSDNRNIYKSRIQFPSEVKRVPLSAIQNEHLIEGLSVNSNNTYVISGAIVSPQFGGGFRPIMNGKSPCLLATSSNYAACLIINGDDMALRKLTPAECCRLQTVPEWYEWICSETQTYRLLGNGWTVAVISHIFQYLKD